jgi:hypothetical protein
MSLTALLTALAFVRYPAVIVGAVAVFGFSSQSALSLLATNAGQFTKPIAVSKSFNLPPPVQLADLTPKRVAPSKPRNDGAGSMGIESPAAATVALAVDTMSTSLPARIGPSAVNLRARASKSSSALGVLDAGTPVRLGREDHGWVEVSANGLTGWVYNRYLDRDATVSITVSGGVASVDPS